MPASSALRSSFLRSSFLTPPCILSARMVATSTTQSGARPGLAALDVEEFLGAEIGAEAGFGHHIVGELERGGGGEHRVAAVRDIGEGAAVDEGGRAFQRLHQIGRQRVLEQRGHRPVRLQFAGAHRFAVAGIADDDIGEPALEVVEVAWPGRRSPSPRRRR